MPFETLLIFIPASFALNLSPGPNNLLAISNAVRYGFLRAFLATSGRLFAFVLMIALTAAGLSVLLSTSELAFYLIKIFGAAYLVYLGVKTWRAPVTTHGELPASSQVAPPLAQLVRQEFLVAIGNPKAILIFTAFFPQFMTPGRPALTQFAAMGAAFLLLEIVAIAIYALSGRQLSQVLRSVPGRRLFNRLSGGALMGAGALLSMSKRTS